MTTLKRVSLIAAIGAVIAAAPAAAKGPIITKRVARAAPAGADAAAYALIKSPYMADQLVGVSCTCADRVEIHHIVTGEDGKRNMVAEPMLDFPIRSELAIAPGSPWHFMLIGLKEPLVAGKTVNLALQFKRIGTLRRDFAVVDDSAAGWKAAE